MSDTHGSLATSGLLNFRVENFRSLRDPMTLTLIGTSLAEQDSVRHIHVRGNKAPIPVLPAAALYGPNASGKSNVLIALNRLRLHVTTSFRDQTSNELSYPQEPFLLDARYIQERTHFELDAIIDGVIHTYGFSIQGQHYSQEWAVHYPHGRPANLFQRDGTQINFGPALRGQGKVLSRLLRPNVLFLSIAGATNFDPLLPLYTWIYPRLRLAQESNRDQRELITTDLLERPDIAGRLLNLIRAADLGISAVRRRDPTEQELQFAQAVFARFRAESKGDIPPDMVPEPVTPLEVLHRGHDGTVPLDSSYESKGTLAWISLLGQVVHSLAEGLVLLVDELDGSLHPALAQQLIRLYQDPRSNPRGAQIVFTTHDATLLGDSSSERIIGRDQVWLTEKDADGSSRLFALSDQAPRKQEALGRRYLAGRYGGIPILSRSDFRAAVADETLVASDANR